MWGQMRTKRTGDVDMPIAEPSPNGQDTWRIFRIMAEFVEGFEVMGPVGGRGVSIFGSARTRPEDPHYRAAEQTARDQTISIKVPIKNRPRTAKMIFEHSGVEGESNEGRDKKTNSRRRQTSMRHAMEQPQ